MAFNFGKPFKPGMASFPTPCALLTCSPGSEQRGGTGQERGPPGETHFLPLPFSLPLPLPFPFLTFPLLLLRFFFLDLSMERTR